MDLTGIFKWLNSVSTWISGFFPWLYMWVGALIKTAGVVLQDGIYRMTFWMLKLVFAGLAAVSPPSVNFGQSLESLSAGAVDFLMAAGIPQAISAVFSVVIFKFILRVVPIPWRA